MKDIGYKEGMKTSLDCIACFIRQALDATRLVSTDTAVHQRILREVLRWAGEMDMDQPAPVMGQRIHRLIRKIVGIDDPYRGVKDHQNRMALALLPELKTKIEAATDPLIMALRLAIAGNVIDMGVNGNVTESDVRKSVIQALTEPFVGPARVTVAVRGSPVINDATRAGTPGLRRKMRHNLQKATYCGGTSCLTFADRLSCNFLIRTRYFGKPQCKITANAHPRQSWRN